MTDEKLKISIIVPSKNRFQDVIKCIESILVQTLLPNEIVIVDSSDTTELKSKLDDLLHNKITFKYIHALLSLTQARNVGIKESTGDIIIFLDDDVILDKEYIKEIMHVFNNDSEKKVGGVTGNIMDNTEIQNRSFKRLIGGNIMHVLATIFFLFKHSNGKFQLSGWPTFVHSDKTTKIECLSGANMAFRREIFNEFKFDENLKGYSFMEDDDIAYRVSRKYQNVYTPFAKLIHNVSPAARDKAYARMKMTIENHHYLFKKNFPQDFKHKFAFWWSVIGLFVIAMVNRNREGLKGLREGVVNIKRNKRNVNEREGGRTMKMLKNIEEVCKMVFNKIVLTNYDKFQRIFWEMNAKKFYETWGGVTTGNYKVLSIVMDKYKPSSVIDIGCGSGRYFKLYRERNIKDIIGIDISGKALKLANRTFPDIETINIKVEDIKFEHKRFDLAISNRVLQHISRKNIDVAIKKICYSSNLVYLNELTDSDGVPENEMMFKHDYEKIFEKNGFMLKEKGYIEPTEIKGRKIGRQTWLLFSACGDKNISEK